MEETTHPHPHPHLTTPTKIIRKLSHSKILTHHLPHLRISDSEKEGSDSMHSVEAQLPHHQNETVAGNKKDLGSRLRGLPGGKYLGLFLALFASVILSLVTLLIKTMHRYHAFSLVLWRLQGVLFPATIALSCLSCGPRRSQVLYGIWPAKLKIILLLVFRGLFGCGADVFQYCSLKYLSLADSSVISFSTPIFVTFVAHFALGEKLGVVPVVTAVFSFFGVVIISRPPILTGQDEFNSDILIGNALAFGCMIMGTFTFVILRTLRSVHSSLTIFSFGFFGSLEVLVLCGIANSFELPRGAHDWALAIAIAILYCIAQLSLTLAFQLEDAGPVALVRSCDVIFAFLWQYVFLGETPDKFSIIGGIIVIFGVFVTALRKFLTELPPTHRTRRTLRFLLI